MDSVLRPVLSAITAGTVAVTIGQLLGRHKQEAEQTSTALAPCATLLLLLIIASLRRRSAAAAGEAVSEDDDHDDDTFADTVGSPDQRQKSFTALLGQQVVEAEGQKSIREESDAGESMSAESQDSDQDSHNVSPEQPPRVPAAIPQPPADQVSRVMVIDDDNINHMVIKRVLSKAGDFDIRKFMAADAALAELETLHARSGVSEFPHVVLMDVNMPGISGLEAAQIIRKTYPDAKLPVIVITGHASAHVRETALDAGCMDVVVKPIQASDLVSKVTFAAGRRRGSI